MSKVKLIDPDGEFDIFYHRNLGFYFGIFQQNKREIEMDKVKLYEALKNFRESLNDLTNEKYSEVRNETRKLGKHYIDMCPDFIEYVQIIDEFLMTEGYLLNDSFEWFDSEYSTWCESYNIDADRLTKYLYSIITELNEGLGTYILKESNE